MAFDAHSGRTADPVDIAVGRRMRDRRKSLHISQDELGKALGISFQQVQKYELGANRVSASKLYYAARTLKTPVASFYFGLPDPVDASDAEVDVPPAGTALTDSRDGLRLVMAAERLSPALLAQLARVAEAMAPLPSMAAE